MALEIMYEQSHLKLKSPFTAIVAAPSGAGKTFFLRQLLREYKTQTDIKDDVLNVIWCYGQWQSGYRNDVSNVRITFHDGLVDEAALSQLNPKVIVIDDLMTELRDSSQLAALFTKISHHRGISVFFLTQNVFCQGREMRNVSLNAHYFVLLKNPRDRLQVATLGRQIFPGKGKKFQEIFDDATSRPYGYLLIDMKPTTPEQLRLRTRILCSETKQKTWSPIIYRIQ